MLLFIKNRSQDTEVATLDEIRRQIAMNLLILLMIIGTLVNTITLVTTGDHIDFIGYSLAVGSLIAYTMLYRQNLTTIAVHIPIIVLVVILFGFVSDGSQYRGVIELGTLIVTAILARFNVYAIVCIAVAVRSFLLQLQIADDTNFIMTSILTIGTSAMVFYVVNRFGNIANSARRINTLLQGSSNIGQIINTELDMQQLLDNTANTVREEFNFYHVQVFLIDDNHQYANLVASTGEAGRQLLARKHQLQVGSRSVIGRVTQLGEPVVAQDTAVDRVHALNDLLPDTRAELALPLIDSGNIIGALDVQSVQADAFQPIDIQALQIIANQLAVAIRNARLFEEAQQNIQENKQLLTQYEINLREVDRLNQILVKQSWDSYVPQLHVDGVTFNQDSFVPQADWSDIMRDATQSQKPQSIETDTTKVVAVPIILQGQALGAIEVELDAKTNATEAMEIAESISQRLAISLESARLFEQTQIQAQRESTANEIGGLLLSSTDVQSVLQTAVDHFNMALGAVSTRIYLQPTTVQPHERQQQEDSA